MYNVSEERFVQMDYLIVSEGKMKIMLERSEVEKYGLLSSELDYSDKNVRASFWRLLDDVRAASGFDTAGEKVLIQFYPVSFGAEIFVTKLGSLSKSAERTVCESNKIAMLSEERRIYRFEILSDFLRALAANRDILSDRSEAYLSEDGKIYLIAEERNLRPYSSFTEFGTELPKTLAGYIRERTREIPEPLKRLSSLDEGAF